MGLAEHPGTEKGKFFRILIPYKAILTCAWQWVNQKVMIKNIEFQYSNDAFPDPAVESFYKKTINMWLSALAYEINDENAVVEYRINKNEKNHITFRNISPQLYKRVMEKLARFTV